MKNELVSIIVPIYNAEESIHKCITSIQKQTYTNIEIILVNDGSTDNSQVICEKYAIKDSRIKLIKQKNSGVSVARNTGLKMASGKYIQFVDSDDFISIDMTKCLVSELEKTQVDWVISGVEDLLENQIICTKKIVNTIIEKIFENEVITSVWNKLYIKEKICTGFDEKINYGEDILFNLSYIKNIQKILLIQKNYYTYQHINPISLTRKYNSKRLEMSEVVYLKVCKCIKELEWDTIKTKQEISSLYIKNIIYGLYMESIFNDREFSKKVKIWGEKKSFKIAIKRIPYFSLLYILSFMVEKKMIALLKVCFYGRYKIKGILCS